MFHRLIHFNSSSNFCRRNSVRHIILKLLKLFSVLNILALLVMRMLFNKYRSSF